MSQNLSVFPCLLIDILEKLRIKLTTSFGKSKIVAIVCDADVCI